MAHMTKEKEKLVARVRRIAGQVAAIESALLEEQECADVMQLIASCRGAMSGLMLEVIEEHLGEHVTTEKQLPKRVRGADELLEVLRTYLR